MDAGIKRNLWDYIELFYRYSKLNFKLVVQYKFDRFFITIAILCREMISVIIMYLILARFIHIRDWQMNELFFLYSFLFISYSLFTFLFTGIRDFDSTIYYGEFDRYLLRPLGLFYQLIASRMDYSATIGHALVGIILLLNTAFSVGIQWTALNIVYYILALLGGALIQAAIFMLSSCINFWAIKTTNLRNLIFFNCRRFAGYPITFYPMVIQQILTFVVPFAFINFFPVQYFLRKSDLAPFWHGFLYLTPLVGVLVFSLVFQLWRLGVRSYSSTGTSMN